MHFCRAKVLIGGDNRNVMVRSEFNPVSWPEVQVLQEVHGTGSVEDVEPFVAVKQKAKDERERLARIYGEAPLQQIWGGRNAPDELEAPEARLVSDLLWFNPLTQQAETTGKGGKNSQPVPPQAPPPEGPSEQTRPAVEVVGQPVAGSPEEENDPYSEYDQEEKEEKEEKEEPEPDPTETPKKPARKR